MRRIPTTFALAAWTGFFIVTCVEKLQAPEGAALPVAFAIICPGLLSAFSLVRLHSERDAAVRQGELLAFATIGICLAMATAALIFGSPFAEVFGRLDLAFWSVGLSLLAIAFDACIFAPEGEDELSEIAFKRTVKAIEASIPRQDRQPRSSVARKGEEF